MNTFFVTFQDLEQTENKEQFILETIQEFINSSEYSDMSTAEIYILGENSAIDERPKWKVTKTGKQIDLNKNVVKSNYLHRFILQINQYLLTNGVSLEDENMKAMLGNGFDKTFESAGKSSLIFGKSYLYKNYDAKKKTNRIVMFPAMQFIPIVDERTSEPKAGIRFWQLTPDKPLQIEFYELDGVTDYEEDMEIENTLIQLRPKRPYKIKANVFNLESGDMEIDGGENYDKLPIVVFKGNDYGRTALSEPIKTKIDAIDRIMTDFDNTLERAKDVYWAISNFGGDKEEALALIADLNEIFAAFPPSDGTGHTSAEPHTIQIPYQARLTAIDLLRKELYADFMVLNMDTITGGSLTNVAINVASFNLSLTVAQFENQAFEAVRKLLELDGIETENIKFKKQSISNATEDINNILAQYDKGLIDMETALDKFENIDLDEKETVMKRLKDSPNEKRIKMLIDLKSEGAIDTLTLLEETKLFDAARIKVIMDRLALEELGIPNEEDAVPDEVINTEIIDESI